jgi:signal transduction histidine kinase
MATFGTRILAENVFENYNSAFRGGVKHLIRQQVGLPFPDSPLEQIQKQQDGQAQKQLLDYIFYINLLAIVIGGPLSYWFAGRTLKPIEDAHELQSKFASDASHELRTPLSVMKTENEVFLRQKNFSDDEAREQIISNLEEVQRLELLTNNLLALSDFNHAQSIKLSIIESKKVANDAIHQISKIFPEDSKRITLSIENIKIFGNLESLSQILFIFLDNAIKYSPEDKPIELIGTNNGANYQFSVVDNGPGIKAKDMPYIFERLYRGDKNLSKNIPGHGLGLALAKEIARANEAGLSVKNNPKSGAIFNLIVVKKETK